MREIIAHDASALPRYTPDRRSQMWWGIVGLILIEASVVASFIASYLYLRVVSEVWPPPGVAPPDLLLPTLNLVLMLVSAGTMWQASRDLDRGRQGRFVANIAASCLLAAAVLGLRWLQLRGLEYSWADHAYGSVVWTITGFHFVHVISAILGTAVVGVLGHFGYFDRERQIAVVVDTMYWYFVAAVWIPFYVVLYWVPRMA